jgi:non-lysosomal glucosylceramidase
MSDLPCSRREFMAVGAGALGLAVVDGCTTPASAAEKLGTHHIPEDKNLDQNWVESLFARGQAKAYQGDELTCIGMPIGGICAGQLYLRGDGTLAEWGIFNLDHFTGYGETCYRTYTPPSPVQQGFGVWVRSGEGKPAYRELSRKAFPNTEFVGEYPIGQVRYKLSAGDDFPLAISLEAFSPFIPLDARESATPGTILKFHVRNTSNVKALVGLGGWLQNTVCRRHAGRARGLAKSSSVRSAGMTSLLFSAEERPLPSVAAAQSEVFADFESGTYGNWKATGAAFGAKPVAGTLPNQQKVSGYGGKYLVNSFSGGDDSTGTLTSPEFKIHRPYISFRIGGGNHPGKTCINLKIGEKVVRTATGKNDERLVWDFWEVSEFNGRNAVLQIVDAQKGGWGHINIDDIQFGDLPPKDAPAYRLAAQPDFGTLALSVLDAAATISTNGFQAFPENGELEREPQPVRVPLDKGATGGIASRFTLAPGESKEVVCLLTWHFAGGEHGRAYGNWFKNSIDVARHLADNLDRLTRATHLFHDTYYNSTLPHWFLDRIMMPISTLATNTVQWRRNGRFWAWEGVGCCHGTCTHVWNYAHGMARLFPELERSARVMQDLGPALDPKTGRVGFRGEDPSQPYAADGQCGTVLKCYREHLMSTDGSFLWKNWPRIKKVMEYSIVRDGNADGVLEDKQWNTFDLDFVGPNTFVGALYLAALKAAATMADLQGDQAFAGRCRTIADKGGSWSAEHLWNGEYFVQHIPPRTAPKFQYGDGCLADHLFGQNWADQLGLGYLYPAEKVRAALKAIYRYNWAPNIAAQNRAHPPQRWFARPGDAGLLTCTWPKGGRMQEPVLYRDEVWTGTEYQVASHLLHEGLIREGLSIVRGIHERYDGRHHNPWNEVECGDHYARALASWGCLIALSGFVYDGPAGKLAFAPRWQTDDFKAFFTAAEGWGALQQERTAQTQRNIVEVAHGRLVVRELAFELPAGAKASTIDLPFGPKGAATTQTGTRVTLTFNEPATIAAGTKVEVAIAWRKEE